LGRSQAHSEAVFLYVRQKGLNYKWTASERRRALHASHCGGGRWRRPQPPAIPCTPSQRRPRPSGRWTGTLGGGDRGRWRSPIRFGSSSAWHELHTPPPPLCSLKANRQILRLESNDPYSSTDAIAGDDADTHRPPLTRGLTAGAPAVGRNGWGTAFCVPSMWAMRTLGDGKERNRWSPPSESDGSEIPQGTEEPPAGRR